METLPATAPHVAVVGAGLAGLAAAHRLARHGAAVTVFEAESWLGGRTRTDVVDGYAIDAGFQVFGSTHTEVMRLLREVGAAGHLVRLPGRDALWRDGRVHEVVYGSVTSMLASGAIPFGTKMRMGASYLPFLMRHAEQLPLHALERAHDAGLDAESIADWGRREMGRDFVEYLAYPLLAASYNLAPEETSAALYHALAHAGLNLQMYALQGGAATLAQAVAAALRQGGAEVRLSTPVARVEFDGAAALLHGEGWAESYDAVVIAVPAPRARALLLGAAGDAERWLGEVEYRAAVSVALLLDRPTGPRYFGLSLPRGPFHTVATISIEENKVPSLVPPEKGLVVVFPTPAAGERLLEVEPRAVVDAVLPELERVLPGVGRHTHRARVYHWPQWSVVFRPGYLGHLQRFHHGQVEAQLPMVLAGDYLKLPGVEGAVASGCRAAERLLARLGQPAARGGGH